MKFFLSGKSAFPLLIAVLLLVLPPLTPTSFFSARGSEGKASQHWCSWAAEQAASGVGGGAGGRCCSLYPGSEGKAALAFYHSSSGDASAVYLRVSPCGGPEDCGIDAKGNKIVSTGPAITLVVNSDFWAANIHKEPGDQSLRPAVPPPETCKSL